MGNPREILRAYAEKRASVDDVMRVLVEHDGWHVPVHLLSTNVADKLIVYAEQAAVPAETALVFTDREGADAFVAKHGGKPLGVYAAPIAGVDLFGALASDRPECKRIRELRVNEAAPQSEFWFMGAGAFALSARLARAVVLERAFAAASAGNVGDLAELMRSFDGWTLPVGKADRSFVRVTLPGGEHVVLFTAGDRAKALTQTLPPEQAEKLGFATLTGQQLFPLLAQAPYAGAIINPNSEPQFVAPAELLKLLA